MDDAASCEELERISQQSSLCTFSSQGVNNYSIYLQCVVQEYWQQVAGRGPGGRPTNLFEKWTRVRGEVPFPEEGHWIRYNENIRSYLRQHVSGDNLRERIQQLDRRHGLLEDLLPLMLLTRPMLPPLRIQLQRQPYL